MLYIDFVDLEYEPEETDLVCEFHVETRGQPLEVESVHALIRDRPIPLPAQFRGVATEVQVKGRWLFADLRALRRRQIPDSITDGPPRLGVPDTFQQVKLGCLVRYGYELDV